MNQSNQIGEMVSGIIGMGFSVNLFNRWKIDPIKSGISETDQNQSNQEEDGTSVESPEPMTPAGPIFYCAIQSNELRMTPELNSRLLKADSLLEVLEKTFKVAKYIIDNSTPVQ